MMRRLLVVVALALLIYGMLPAWLYWRQERLLFMPQPLPVAHSFALGDDIHELLARPPGGDADLRAQTVRAALHGAALLEIALMPGSGDTWPWRDLQARITAVAELVAVA